MVSIPPEIKLSNPSRSSALLSEADAAHLLESDASEMAPTHFVDSPKSTTPDREFSSKLMARAASAYGRRYYRPKSCRGHPYIKTKDHIDVGGIAIHIPVWSATDFGVSKDKLDVLLKRVFGDLVKKTSPKALEIVLRGKKSYPGKFVLVPSLEEEFISFISKCESDPTKDAGGYYFSDSNSMYGKVEEDEITKIEDPKDGDITDLWLTEVVFHEFLHSLDDNLGGPRGGLKARFEELKLKAFPHGKGYKRFVYLEEKSVHGELTSSEWSEYLSYSPRVKKYFLSEHAATSLEEFFACNGDAYLITSFKRDHNRDSLLKKDPVTYALLDGFFKAGARDPKLLSRHSLSKVMKPSNTEDPDLCMHLGLDQLRSGKLDRAEEFLERARSLAPARSDILLELASLMDIRGNDKKADILRIQAHRTACEQMRKVGKFDDSISECRRVVALNPKEVVYHIKLGEVLLEAGRTEAAVLAFREALECNPNAAQCVILGRLLISAGFPKVAIEAFREMVSSDWDDNQIYPMDSRTKKAYILLAESYLAADDPEMSVKAFKKAAKLNLCRLNDNFQFHEALRSAAELKERRGDYYSAIEFQEELVELSKSSEERAKLALLMLKRWIAKDGVLDEEDLYFVVTAKIDDSRKSWLRNYFNRKNSNGSVSDVREASFEHSEEKAWLAAVLRSIFDYLAEQRESNTQQLCTVDAVRYLREFWNIFDESTKVDFDYQYIDDLEDGCLSQRVSCERPTKWAPLSLSAGYKFFVLKSVDTVAGHGPTISIGILPNRHIGTTLDEAWFVLNVNYSYGQAIWGPEYASLKKHTVDMGIGASGIPYFGWQARRIASGSILVHLGVSILHDVDMREEGEEGGIKRFYGNHTFSGGLEFGLDFLGEIIHVGAGFFGMPAPFENKDGDEEKGFEFYGNVGLDFGRLFYLSDQ